jgi:hypothetical protein
MPPEKAAISAGNFLRTIRGLDQEFLLGFVIQPQEQGNFLP